MSELSEREVASILQETIPSQFQDLLASVSLVNNEIEHSKAALDKTVQKAISRNEYDTARKLMSTSEALHHFSENIVDFLNQYKTEDPDSKEFELLSDKQNSCSTNRVDYDAYRVDETVAHDLFSPVTHRRPAAFSFKGEKYNVSTWCGMLISFCELLYDLDQGKFNALLYDKKFRGKKRLKLSRQKERMRKGAEIKDSGIYVETNLSANDIRELIAVMLNAYGISYDAVKFYLSKDLSVLHTDEE